MAERNKFETILVFNRGERLIEPVIIKKPKLLSKELFGPVLTVYQYKTLK